MPIPEEQLETWSNQGATVAAKRTHESVRAALAAERSPIKERVNGGTVELYLQGSYRNDTNIRGDSDVDLVAELTTTFSSNLSATEKQQLGVTQATYVFSDFRQDIIRALERYYGAHSVDASGSKSIKVLAGSGRLAADVVPCIQYRLYSQLVPTATGISFWSQDDHQQIINFPKRHYENGCGKNSRLRTNGWYKPTVRLFKNARSYIIDRQATSADLAPSYFLECAIYNAADNDFGVSYQDTFVKVFTRLYNMPFEAFICQNEQLLLFDNSSIQWSSADFIEFMGALKSLWEGW